MTSPIYAIKSEDDCVTVYAKQKNLFVHTRQGADISDLTIVAADNFVTTFLSVVIILDLLALMLLPISNMCKKKTNEGEDDHR